MLTMNDSESPKNIHIDLHSDTLEKWNEIFTTTFQINDK